MEPPRKRPGAATLLGVLAYLSAFVNLMNAIASIVLLFRPGQVQELFGDGVSDIYWVISAALSGFLFFAYIWLAKGVFAGMEYAWTVVNLLAIINLIYGLFYIFQGTGLITVTVSILVILLNNTRRVREWYGTT